ncbi:MAG: DUF364 domain-containing protein [Synergistaceae bacterium]|jgi:uncharacterized protein (DUF4213/DUF364 family)|nr:DUF364 domain-containing protein [Synergistaceae bacterium]
MRDKKNGIFFNLLQENFVALVDRFDLKDAEVKVTATPLSPEDAIGATKRKDYVILKGKERLLEASVMGSKGQAFTSSQGDFSGTLNDVLNMKLENDYERAVYVSTLNAVVRYTDAAQKTIHCRNEGPELCALKVAEYFKKNFGTPNILMAGYQPTLAEALNEAAFSITVTDLDPNNVGKIINGVYIRNANDAIEECISSCDVIFATGSAICNGTIDKLYDSGKPLVLFGTTGAGAAALLGIPRFCPEAS